MKTRIFFLSLFALLVLIGCSTPSSTTGSNPTSNAAGNAINGKITGSQYKDHKIYFNVNQQLVVNMEAGSPTCYFNILTPEGEMIHNGSSNGNKFSGTMSFTGYYTVRVYLMGAAKSENQRVNYTIRYTLQ
jgi:hypothetical protein